MDTWSSIDRLMIISSDAHAGALPQHYRAYLPSRWHGEFDDWLAQITMPWFDMTDDRNWDSAQRMRAPTSFGMKVGMTPEGNFNVFCRLRRERIS